MKIEKIKKTISIVLMLFLVIGRTSMVSVLATETEGDPADPVQEEPVQEEDPVAEEPPLEEEATTEGGEVENNVTPTPTPTPEAEIDNEADVINDTDSEAITGENTIEGVTPTPTPELCTETTEEETELIEGEEATEAGCETQEEVLEVACDEEAEEGEGCVSDELGEGEPAAEEVQGENSGEPASSEIGTGDAVSVVVAENDVNSTEINSEVIFQTLNIFVPGDINLTVSPLAIANNVFNGDQNSDSVINVNVYDGVNYAYLSNDVVNFANTGANEIEGSVEASINTGDAYAIAALLNKVNTTIVDSTIHIVTINIFGNVDGNILLPEFDSSGDEGCCEGSVAIDNNAEVVNEVDSLAVSGQNTIETSTGSATIATGNATSTVSIFNVVNKTLMDTVFHHLYINNLGIWVGNFVGWDGFLASPGGQSLLLSSSESGDGNGGCSNCISDVNLNNQAYVFNNVISYANTGGNTINGGQAAINTGDAYSAVSIFNFINTTILRSYGFLGSINIFGALEGDIGGASMFIEEEPEAETTQESGGEGLHESGGELEIYQYNNVGTHVLPGDTVTFFVTIRNPGTGRVFGTNLAISLINEEGVDMGGGVFEIGEIKPGKGVKITTGLVLTQDAEPGNYIAHAVVSGHVGPDDEPISEYSDSFFLILGAPLLGSIVEPVQAEEPEPEVLGVIVPPAGDDNMKNLQYVFFLLSAIYLPSKGYAKRKEIAEFSVRGWDVIGEKSMALRSLLANLLA